ncbi:uncharacterized protein LOC62_02G003026 [Vanrija pseudolonga]|uniref:BTB domain-containing protein n=1 Tax=Vanrija pseudolonga TaxID=143232 RepID=A0AAF0Y391_9TREE|nr:hypothetical protein LOC62_02G003026 [Vanrija pseudolonga]
MPYLPKQTKGIFKKGHTRGQSLPGTFKPGSFTSLASLALSDSASETSYSTSSYTPSVRPADKDTLTIISLDNVHIEAPYTQVCAASRALADLVAHYPCGWDPERSAVAQPQIHLYHGYEDAGTVRRFLELITTGSLQPAFANTLVELTALVRFLNKYDCVAALAVLFLHIRIWLSEGAISPLVAFVCAAIADNEEACVRAISVADPLTLDPRHMSLEAWYRIPHHYLYALTHATMVPARNGPGNPGMVAKFKGHLRDAKKYYGYPVPSNGVLEKLDSMEQWRG